MGMKINARGIRSRCFFNSKNVTIGKGCSINYNCQFHSSDPDYSSGGFIRIGENCYLGMNVTLCTITHEVGDETQRAAENKYLPIVIEDGCWVGANSTILPGVTIEKGCIIAAGSVVTKNCESNGVYAGVPARRIKELP